eukprot:4923593-Amphidinium_carterae.5
MPGGAAGDNRLCNLWHDCMEVDSLINKLQHNKVIPSPQVPVELSTQDSLGQDNADKCLIKLKN